MLAKTAGSKLTLASHCLRNSSNQGLWSREGCTDPAQRRKEGSGGKASEAVVERAILSFYPSGFFGCQ